MSYIPEFMINADNVYRTNEFIVRQSIIVQADKIENTAIISYDTYYRRTRVRDFEYEIIFAERQDIEGKRLPSNMYVRRYKE